MTETLALKPFACGTMTQPLTPYCVAAGFVDGRARLQPFTDARVADPALRVLADGGPVDLSAARA